MLLLQQMIALFIFILIGYFMRTRDILDQKGSRALSWLIVYIASPCMIVAGGLARTEPLSVHMMKGSLITCITAYVYLILCSLILPALLGFPKEERGLYQLMTIFTNIGFMGYPLLSAMYGPESLVYASLGNIIYSLIFYTYGIRTLQKGSGKKVPFRITNIINPGTISCVLVIVVALLRPPVPTFVRTTIDNLGALPPALAMIVIGSSLTEFRLSDLFSDWKIIVYNLIKLLVLPTVIILLMKPFITDPALRGVMLILTATPVGSLVVMAAQQYDSNYPLAARNIALSTLLSVVTIPVVAMITGL